MIFNKIKTVILLAGLSGLFLFLGNLFGGMAGLQFALIIALLMNGIAYFFSDKIVLHLYDAQPLDEHEYAWVYHIVDELRQSMRLPMPSVYLIDTQMANAFATGRDPHHASIALTTGIISLLERHELRGVIAHELAHVKNRDILITTIAATLATAIGYVANMLQHAALWGASTSRNKRGDNPFVLLFIAILMPLAATLIQLAISRSREYLADETGAHFSDDPLALASALEKLHNHIPHAHLSSNNTQQASTAPLFIVHPFSGGSLLSLFSTHPPMHERVIRLRALYEKKILL
jgi:heat shock protein HtpX